MPSYFPALKNSEHIAYISLVDSANRPDLKATPTIAAGDFKVSTDGGALGNMDTLPVVTPAGSVFLKLVWSASEMNGDNIALVGIDAAGAEWDDFSYHIQTTEDTYQGKLVLLDDDFSGFDRYGMEWYKNSEAINSGITVPKIQVIQAADGLDLVADTAMTEVGALGHYRYFEGTNRVTDGLLYLAVATATIDGATRTWPQWIGRDRAA